MVLNDLYISRDNTVQKNRAIMGYLRKVRKTARIKNRYNQEPHMSQDTKWDSNKITINITNKSQAVSHFPSRDDKAAMNRHKGMTNTRHK